MQAAAPTLSPIRTWRNPQDLLAEFFDWLVQQPGYGMKPRPRVIHRSRGSSERNSGSWTHYVREEMAKA
jgi:hypothetical protein